MFNIIKTIFDTTIAIFFSIETYQFLFCLLITVSIHELAHMLVALKCGMGVKAFSIGFGKPYLHKTFKGIDFRLSPLPFGGYCDIKGMESKEEPDDFLAHPYRNKFAVLIAGVTVNILFACICYIINFGSIRLGFAIDMEFLKALFTKDYEMVAFLVRNIPMNWLILQLSLLNMFCGLTNLIPFPALDGGHLWEVLLEKPLGDKFIPVYRALNYFGFIFLIILQLYLLWWVYFK